MQKGSPREAGQVQIILIGVLVVAIALAGGFYLAKQTTPKSSPAPVVSYQTPQSTSVPTTTDANPALSGTGETANWKTYTNTKYGFSIQYNPNITIKEEEPGFPRLTYQLTSVNEEDWFYLSITVFSNPNQLSAENYFRKLVEMRRKDNNLQANNNPQAIEINNKVAETALAAIKPYKNGIINGIIVEEPGYEQPTIIVIHASPERFIQFQLVPGFGTGAIINDNHRKIFNQILSTFRFD